MAKLSDRQKKNILAKWHTGQYSKSELARKYKISESMVRKLVNGELPKNKDLVDASVAIETIKRCEISTSERDAIDIEVTKKINTVKIDNELMENNRTIAKMLQQKIVENKHAIELKDIKSLTGAVKDLESVANPQASKVEINNNNQQQTNNLKVSFE